MKNLGGEKVFGTWSDWGDTFEYREEQKKYVEFIPSADKFENLPCSEIITCQREKVNVEDLKMYAESLDSFAKDQICDYIRKIDKGEKFGFLNVNYKRYGLQENDKIKYFRLYGDGIYLQKLPKEARIAATYGHCIEFITCLEVWFEPLRNPTWFINFSQK